MTVREAIIQNRNGLDAILSALVCKQAKVFDARVLLEHGGQQASAKSMMGIMMLTAGPGSTVTISAEGDDAETAVDFVFEILTSPRPSENDIRGKPTGLSLRGASITASEACKLNLRASDLTGAEFAGKDFHGIDLSGAILYRSDLRGANLAGANLGDVDLRKCDLTGACMTEINLRNANCSGAKMIYTDISRGQLSHSRLNEADLSNSRLDQSNLSEAELQKAHLINASLINTNLARTQLKWTDFSGSNLMGCILEDANAVAGNFSGVNFAKADLTRCDFRAADFNRAEIHDARIEGTRFTMARIKNANFGAQKPVEMQRALLVTYSYDDAISRRSFKHLQASSTLADYIVDCFHTIQIAPSGRMWLWFASALEEKIAKHHTDIIFVHIGENFHADQYIFLSELRSVREEHPEIRVIYDRSVAAVEEIQHGVDPELDQLRQYLCFDCYQR